MRSDNRQLPPRGRRMAMLVAVLAGALGSGRECLAQLEVGMEISRREYVRYEPIIAKVTISNLSGRNIVLQDGPGGKWFSFQITGPKGSPLPPTDPDYRVQPLAMAAGETVKRSIDIGPLYPLQEFGLHKIKAVVYFADIDRFFSSPVHPVSITEGRKIWEQTVGVPGGGGMRRLSMLSHFDGRSTKLYLRIMDEGDGTVFATYRLGPLVSFDKPKAVFDTNNELHILQMIAPKQFLYSHVGLDGEIRARTTYLAIGGFPRLRKSESGAVTVVGGQVDAPVAEETNRPRPKLSDRPPGIPAN